MKRRTMLCVVVMLAMFATAPGWAASGRVSSVDQAFGWLGAFWSLVWGENGICVDPNGKCGGPATQGGCGIDPNGNCGSATQGVAPSAHDTPNKGGEITPQGSGCIDPDGRPSPCTG
jgi:hypothetical protein